MKYNKAIGFAGGAAGASIGAFTWTIIIGIQLNSLFLILFPIVISIICIIGVYKLFSLNPER